MSLESAQQSPRVTSFLIKDILASNEDDRTSEATLYGESISLQASLSNSLTERAQNSLKPFPFSDSRIEFGQVNGELDSVHNDTSKTKPQQNPGTNQFEHHILTGKFGLVQVPLFCKLNSLSFGYQMYPSFQINRTGPTM